MELSLNVVELWTLWCCFVVPRDIKIISNEMPAYLQVMVLFQECTGTNRTVMPRLTRAGGWSTVLSTISWWASLMSATATWSLSSLSQVVSPYWQESSLSVSLDWALLSDCCSLSWLCVQCGHSLEIISWNFVLNTGRLWPALWSALSRTLVTMVTLAPSPGTSRRELPASGLAMSDFAATVTIETHSSLSLVALVYTRTLSLLE